MARGAKLRARASAIALLPEREPPVTRIVLLMAPLVSHSAAKQKPSGCERQQAKKSKHTPDLSAQAPPADDDTTHRDDQSKQGQQPHHGLPCQAMAKQQGKIEAV